MSIQITPGANQATGVIPAALRRVRALSVLPDYRLAVRFMDGTKGTADFQAILNAMEPGTFGALKDKTSFDQARLELGVVTWPNGADIDPAWRYEQIRGTTSWSVQALPATQDPRHACIQPRS